jgi:hypothetical protein
MASHSSETLRPDSAPPILSALTPRHIGFLPTKRDYRKVGICPVHTQNASFREDDLSGLGYLVV